MEQNRALRVLEFTKIREMLAQHAITEEGKQRCLELTPYHDLGDVNHALAETEEAVVLLTYLGQNPLVSYPDVRESIARAQKGACLSPRMLLDISAFLRAARAARSALVREREDTPILTGLASRLTVLERVETDINDAILSEEEIADRASADLYQIRRQIRSANERMRDKLNQMIRSSSFAKNLQDSIITMRGDRYCIPVKAECRANVPGLVHDQSASGATLFIEPMFVVELGNDLKQLYAREQQEITRILQALSDSLAPYGEALEGNLALLRELDFAFAKGLLGRQMRAVLPKINREGRLKIVRGRHPLIDPEKVVPSDLWLGQDFTTLVITGPNTGGKTVTLKTAGLLCAMAQCGFLIPAHESSTVCVFQEYLVDIGDEQSIEQSLSTFSGHMKKITGILEKAWKGTLVLLDELGAGTDPAEGAALAVSIIEELRRQGARVMATTHYAEMKVFALETPGVVNASCEFDVESLRPTYKLSVGVPGKSNAFLISEKLGIPSRIIEAAKSHMDNDDKRLDSVLSQLDDLKLQLKEGQDEIDRLKYEAAHQLESAQKKREELIRQGENELQAAREKAKQVAQQVQAEAYALTDELRKLQKDEKTSAAQRAIRAREIAKKDTEKLLNQSDVVHPIKKEYVPLKEVRVGQEVVIAELDQPATVVNLPDRNGMVEVRAGIIKTKVPLKGLRAPDKMKKAPAAPKRSAAKREGGHTTLDRVQRTASMEADLRGLTVEEALMETDQYIDHAVLSGQSEIWLIHGKGTGALRSAIQQHLKGHKNVKSFRLGRYGEGEAGVTVVELK